MTDSKTITPGTLDPVPEGTQIENKHNAVLKFSAVYDGRPPLPGFIWVTFKFIIKKHKPTFVVNVRPEKSYMTKVAKATRVGGVAILKSFVSEHGEANVLNMVLFNIVNKIKI